MGSIPPSDLRQPPPPSRCLLIDSNKISAPMTTKAEGDTSRARGRPFYSRRCKKPILEFESLPDELLMEIMLRLSADEIYDKARLVCRRWRHLIHTEAFVREHLHRASSGLLLTPLMGSHMDHPPIFLTTTTQGRLKMSRLSCIIRFPVVSSCNGLSLCLRKGKSRGRGATLFIFNPTTKCAFDLPSFPVRKLLIYTLGMAYAAASMAYKVFGAYHKSGTTHFVMLTVGVDKTWRHVKLEGFPPESSWDITGISIPLITGFFLHWVSNTRVVSLNVETEMFTLTLTPSPARMFPQEGIRDYCGLSTGRSLSLFVRCGDLLSWEVWEMKPETWEWRKVIPKINLEPHKSKIQWLAWQKDNVLTPIGWVRYPKVLAFFFQPMGHYCIIYNLDTDNISVIMLSVPAKDHCVVQHRNSLLWLPKC